MSNTHEEFVSLPGGGHAFITGVPDECEHDWTGDEYFISQSGKLILWHTYRKWASLISQDRSRKIHKHHMDIDDPIIEGGVTCKKCKKLFKPDINLI